MSETSQNTPLESCCKSMKKFNETMAGLQFNVSDGDIEGAIVIQSKSTAITFNDGYRNYPSLIINYCPYCGQRRK